MTGLRIKIHEVALAIDFGRKGFAIRGKVEEGGLSYKRVITEALSAFRDAQSNIAPQAIIIVKYTFLSQELQFYNGTDKNSLVSLTHAIQSFDDAFIALQAIEDSAYKIAEKIYPFDSKYKINGFFKVSFHIACIAHRTRLQNMLRTSGVDPIEKALLKQQFANLATGQKGYVEKQGKALDR